MNTVHIVMRAVSVSSGTLGLCKYDDLLISHLNLRIILLTARWYGRKLHSSSFQMFDAIYINFHVHVDCWLDVLWLAVAALVHMADSLRRWKRSSSSFPANYLRTIFSTTHHSLQL